jgi:fumarylacetoacetase
VSSQTWVENVPDDSLFGVHNLPYGVFSTQADERRIGVAIGDYVLDVAAAARAVDDASPTRSPSPAPSASPVLEATTLNPLMAAGRTVWSSIRASITSWLTDSDRRAQVEPHLVPRAKVTLHLPFDPADYVDFYASEHHAGNLGRIFRPDSPQLPPNWKHLPIGYHGRAGSLVVSGTPVSRPNGQRKAVHDSAPAFGPSRRLDFEAEVGFVVGTPSELGEPVALADFEEHVFGVCLVNDWSARDLQAWEYVPLGPFLGKSFATSISPWIVPLEALANARVRPPARDVEPLPYLDDRAAEPWGLDITLEVSLNGQPISRPPFDTMYWTAAQQLAHMTSNGARLRTGDLFASGTVSGAGRETVGSLIERTWNGEHPLKLADGSNRTFLEDGDEVTITAIAPGTGRGAGAGMALANRNRIGFGEVTGRVVPAPS